MKIKLIYGSDTGNTEYVIENNLLGIFESCFGIESIPVNQVTPEDWNSHNFYILGIPTWQDGQLQNDWEDYFDKFKAIDFTGKKQLHSGQVIKQVMVDGTVMVQGY